MNGSDPYVYPGTRVLINKLDIFDKERLATAERLLSGRRAETLNPDIPLTGPGFRAIHQHLFQDLYQWAGHDRIVPLAKGSSLFCQPEFIAPHMDKLFAVLEAEDYLRKSTPEHFAMRAAEHISELNAIHPFREGNGRTQRAFLVCLAKEAGHGLDLARILPAPWHQASIESFSKARCEPMAKIIHEALNPPVMNHDRSVPSRGRGRGGR